ncbi:hypothetical protein ACFYNO_33220 [Kitasatospora sp. NPDC006697]|uniref:hypothetical protein n=1 Tax=Kitasatospora sp. NPDC006697 TaxID=3364020 RepID=UPI0036B39AC2
MADLPDIPDDLLALEERRMSARRDLDLHVATVEVGYRTAYPDPEQIVERRTWTPQETERWHELRAAYAAAAAAVLDHPLLVQAAADGRRWPVEEKLRSLVPRLQVVIRRNEPGSAERVVVLVDGAEELAAAQAA